MRYFTLFVLAYFINSLNVPATFSNFPPLLRNYTDKDYEARFQNWGITQDDNGVMYFANNGGLLSFDGYTWDVTPLPNATILRSILFDDGKIYSGTYKSFGFFDKNDKGEFIYNPLFNPKEFPDHERIDGNEEIWKILKWNKLIIFQSFDNIYSYDPKNGNVSLITHKIKDETNPETESTLNPLFIFTDGASLFAQRSNGDFYKYDQSRWKPYWTLEQLGSPIMGLIIPINSGTSTESVPDGTLLFTRNSGIFKVVNNSPQRFPTEIDNLISDVQINRVAQYHDGSIYIGTIGEGLFHIDREGKLIEHFDTSNGLNNNTILGIMEDIEGNLWVALDDGISLIHSGLPIRILSNTSRYDNTDIGMVYGIGSFDNKLVIASNQGVYYIDSTGKLMMNDELHGQNWFVTSFGRQTFIGGNDETLVLDNNLSSSKYPFSGTAIREGKIHNEDVLLLVNYHDMHVFLKNRNGNWEYSHVVKTLGDPVKQLEIDNDGTIWLSHWANGLLKIKLDPALQTVVSRKDFPSLSGRDFAEPMYVFKIAGEIYFTNGNGIFEWNG